MTLNNQDPNCEQDTPAVSRRQLLLGAGAALAAGYAGLATAAMPGHDHSKHAPQHPDLLTAVDDCLAKGQRCIAHCLVSFKEGDVALADCAAKVHEMQAICGGFSYLLAANSEYVAAYQKLCETACSDCAKECRKHDEHHECRACAEACEATVEAIKLHFG